MILFYNLLKEGVHNAKEPAAEEREAAAAEESAMFLQAGEAGLDCHVSSPTDRMAYVAGPRLH